jgi:2-dehydro-3-deoxyphosphooctonate aldolase (KDO 8-P synthase)
MGAGEPLALIAGPCVIENEAQVLGLATSLAELCANLDLPVVFKTSFDKANRTSLASYRGPGLEEGLRILAAARRAAGIPLTTDVHLPEQAPRVAEVVDLLQVPAFLCRQTDLLVACGATGRPVNLKKGQFMAPGDMRHAIDKVTAHGDGGVMVTERGTLFGYVRRHPRGAAPRRRRRPLRRQAGARPGPGPRGGGRRGGCSVLGGPPRPGASAVGRGNPTPPFRASGALA